MISIRSLSVLGAFSVSLMVAGCGGTPSSAHGDPDGGDSDSDGSAGRGTSAPARASAGGRPSSGGGTSTSGAAASAGGRTSTSTGEGAGAGTSDGGPGGSDVSVDGGGVSDVPMPCGLSDESEPNETLDTGTPYILGSTITGCLASSDDHDFYEFTAPAEDKAGGYVQLALTDVGHGDIELSAYSASDNAPIVAKYGADVGSSVNAWFAVVPGQRYRFDVHNFYFSQEYRYTVKLSYTRVDDAYEPNDTRDAAKAVAYPVSVNALTFAGFHDHTISTDEYDDWYRVTFPAGTATIKLETVGADLEGEVDLVNSSGVRVAGTYAQTDGANVTLKAPVAGGVYTIRASVFWPPNAAGTAPVVADHFTRTYKLSATVAP